MRENKNKSAQLCDWLTPGGLFILVQFQLEIRNNNFFKDYYTLKRVYMKTQHGKNKT